MPHLGLVLGHRIAHALGGETTYVGGGLLIATGGYTLWQARRSQPDHAPVGARLGPLMVTAASLSIDNLIVGFALGWHKVCCYPRPGHRARAGSIPAPSAHHRLRSHQRRASRSDPSCSHTPPHPRPDRDERTMDDDELAFVANPCSNHDPRPAMTMIQATSPRQTVA
jgi:hypothetical protein